MSEQPVFTFQNLAINVPAITADTTGGNYSMTGHHYRYGVGPTAVADGPGSTVNLLCQFAIGKGFTGRNTLQLSPYFLLVRSPIHLQRQVKLMAGIGKILLQLLHDFLRNSILWGHQAGLAVDKLYSVQAAFSGNNR